MSKAYTISWSINVDANTPEEAARLAHDAATDPETLTTVFEVQEGEFPRVTPARYIDAIDIADHTYRNHYHCDRCDVEWEDEWSCMCNDRCPRCNVETEPYQSDDLTV
jgi:hypothetical protein